jgi:hypothetical protein
LERVYFPVYGTPRLIVSDNARVFCCKQFRDLCFRWGVDHITSTPYYPQGSLAERMNRNLKSALKIFHSHSQSKWDDDLPWLSVAFNTAMHESTKFTLDVLFLGRELKSPLTTRWDLTTDVTDNGDPLKRSFWLEAYQNLRQACNRVALRYNKNRTRHKFQTGDWVMYRKNLVSSKINKESAKLMLRWSEALVITEFLRDNVVLLANPKTGVVVRRAHVSQLKSYVR